MVTKGVVEQDVAPSSRRRAAAAAAVANDNCSVIEVTESTMITTPHPGKEK